MNLYRSESSNPKWNAQRNLSGRTHYVDDDTLRFHKSRILYSTVVDNGLMFALIESVAVVMDGSKRGFRYAIFDIFGDCIERPKLEERYATGEKARRAMWDTLNSINAKAHTFAAIKAQEQRYKQEMDELRNRVRLLDKKAA